MIISLRTSCILLLFLCFLQSCFRIHPSQGGGQLSYDPGTRQVNVNDVLLPKGYSIEVVAQGLTFPTAAVEDEQGRLFVVESGYSYGEVFLPPKLLRIEKNGSTTTIAVGEKNGPWTGITYYENNFYIAEGGQLQGGKILRVDHGGNITTLAENLPSLGDHHTNGLVVKDGQIYFGQGTVTNSGVVGTDNADFGWLYRNPAFHDTPCEDVILKGINYTSENPLTEDPNDKITTGAYVPFGETTREGQVIKGGTPCNGAIMRIPLTGGKPEVVAWGLRNPYGMALSPSNELYISENSYDVRGSRPVWGTGDILWKLENGAWYGWPDYSGGHAISHLEVPGEDGPTPLLAEHPGTPPSPVANLGVHSSSNGFDFSSSTGFGYLGEAFIAQFGDMAPAVGKVWKPVGYKVIRVNVDNGTVQDFVVNKGKRDGPASWQKSGGLERPISVNFSQNGEAMYVVDFGILTVGKEGADPKEETGVVWKITKNGNQ